MTMLSTPEEKELEKIFKPYMVGGHFPEDTPEEILQAFEKWKEIGQKRREEEIKSWFE